VGASRVISGWQRSAFDRMVGSPIELNIAKPVRRAPATAGNRSSAGTRYYRQPAKASRTAAGGAVHISGCPIQMSP
jgi:hypothetical protein